MKEILFFFVIPTPTAFQRISHVFHSRTCDTSLLFSFVVFSCFLQHRSICHSLAYNKFIFQSLTHWIASREGKNTVTRATETRGMNSQFYDLCIYRSRVAMVIGHLEKRYSRGASPRFQKSSSLSPVEATTPVSNSFDPCYVQID